MYQYFLFSIEIYCMYQYIITDFFCNRESIILDRTHGLFDKLPRHLEKGYEVHFVKQTLLGLSSLLMRLVW